MRTGAIAKHLDPSDRIDRNRVEIDRRRAATDLGVEVRRRSRVITPPVDQHERLIGRKAAKLRRTHRVASPRVRLAREVERGGQVLKRLRGFADACSLGDVRSGEHINRNRAVENSAICAANPGHHDEIRVGGLVCLIGGRHGLRRRAGLGGRRSRRQGKQDKGRRGR